VRTDILLKNAAFFGQSRRMIAGEPGEEEILAAPQGPREELCGEGSDHSQHGRLGQKPRIAFSYQDGFLES